MPRGSDMADSSWAASHVLCRWNTESHTVDIDEVVMEKLEQLEDDGQLEVISAVGPYRSGKSYLLSRLANKAGGN